MPEPGSLTIAILYVIAGLVLLVGGGEGTVRGASSVAAKLKISPYVIGATVVAFGTSAPELVVTLTASMRGSEELALGNVVGSNIANLGLILGLAGIFGVLFIKRVTLLHETPSYIAVLVLLILFTWNRTVGRIEAFLLMIGGLVFIYLVLKHRNDGAESDETTSEYGLVLSIVLSVTGIALLIGGAQVLVAGSVVIARVMSVPEWVIGVGIVAIGTSLPEVAASTVAAAKGKGDLAVGNVIGSNAFNVFWVLGIGGSIHPITVEQPIYFDLLVFGAFSIFVLLMLYAIGKLPKWSSILLLLGYITYIIARFGGAGGL